MIKQSTAYYVPWRDQGNGIYLYGSKLSVDKHGEVNIENPLMPSGTKIMQWDSHLNYQTSRVEPALPPLEPGRRYVFRAVMKTEPEEGVMFRFDFFDRQQERISHQIIREHKDILILPEDAYSYTLQMIQAGASSICFRHIEIYAEDSPLYKFIQKKKEEKYTHVLFLEPSGISAAVPEGKYIDKIKNLLIVPHLLLNHDHWQNELLELLEMTPDQAQKASIRFLAYGPVSNAAAVWASRKWRYGVITSKADFQSVYEGRKQEMFPALVERCTKLRNWNGNERKTK